MDLNLFDREKPLWVEAFHYHPQDGKRKTLIELKDQAQPENWGPEFKFLDNYISQLYRYIKREQFAGRQLERGIMVFPLWNQGEQLNNFIFNTNLLTSNWKLIYGWYQENKKSSPYWFFKGWHTEDGFNYINRVANLQFPKPISFKRSLDEFFFNPDIKILINTKHILDESQKQERLLASLPASHYDWYKNNSKALEERLNTAIMDMKLRVDQNFRTVIPFYYAEDETIQLLFPLDLVGDGTVRCALTCQKEPNSGIEHVERDLNNPEHWIYIFKTVLTLEMAYMNARLLNRPESEWLILSNSIDNAV